MQTHYCALHIFVLSRNSKSLLLLPLLVSYLMTRESSVETTLEWKVAHEPTKEKGFSFERTFWVECILARNAPLTSRSPVPWHKLHRASPPSRMTNNASRFADPGQENIFSNTKYLSDTIGAKFGKGAGGQTREEREAKTVKI